MKQEAARHAVHRSVGRTVKYMTMRGRTEQRQLRECVWFSPHCTHARQETMFPDETWRPTGDRPTG
jgi:hypothetical protein